MNLKVFTMVEAENLINTASDFGSEDMSVYSQTFVTKEEATLAVKNAIQAAVFEFYDGADIGDDELNEIINTIFESRGQFDRWVWDPADRSYVWMIMEDTVYVHCDCEDDDKPDTTMEQLGYRKDDSERVDNDSPGREYPRLSIGFKHSTIPGKEIFMGFSTPDEALAWADPLYDNGTTEFCQTWIPGIMRVVTEGYARDIRDFNGDWEGMIAELAYACGDDGSFSDPDELEKRNSKYREWYKED